MIKAVSSCHKIDEASIFFQALLSSSAQLFAGFPKAQTGHSPGSYTPASHPKVSLPRVPSWGR